jgi:aspartyl-tRNA(Asn)/glutamyl-tRNA(Gln) amidotransferase subunit A
MAVRQVEELAMPGDDIFALSARALAASVRSGELTASEITHAYLGRIRATEPSILAYRKVTAQLAEQQAEQIDQARRAGRPLGPLAGVPIALKDNFVTEGVETTCGSKILAGWIPPYQGTHAQRLAEAGAVLLGKLAMDEFGMGSSSENTPFEPVRNPWALDHVAGGSSGGSAAAVAARSCVLALGTDTGGSIRQPASLCNIVGLKPTYGRVSRHGMIAFASSFDQAGPMTRDVGDAALALQVLAGVDPRDSTSLDVPVPDYSSGLASGDLAGTTIGLDRHALDLDGLDAEVARCFMAALEQIVDAGATLVDVELPHFDHAVATYYVLSTAEASSNLARYDGVRYGLRVAKPSLRETYEATRGEGFGAEVVRRILLGTHVLAADSYADYYGRAMKVRTLIARDYAAAFARCDVLASPTSPVPGWRLGAKLGDPLAMYLSDVFTIGANLAGLPAISIPAGFTSADPRLPIGLQLIGPRLAEPAILRVAAAYEQRTDWHHQRPPGVSP